MIKAIPTLDGYFCLVDMTIRSQNIPVDVTEVYSQMHLEIVGLPAVDGGHFQLRSTSYGGYDAGYRLFVVESMPQICHAISTSPNKLRFADWNGI